MSSRLEMLQVARLAPRRLGDAAGLVETFFRERVTPEGGFADRDGKPDLYYTVFGLEGLLALQAPLPNTTAAYLRGFGDGEGLDFVHSCCLARCWANVSRDGDGVPAAAIAARIESQRKPDGGFGTAYETFLAVGALEDLRRDPGDAAALVRSVRALAAEDGGYANLPGMPFGQTPATAAAATLLRRLGDPDPSLGMWLLDRCHSGGFFAMPGAPMPDLLSTATALHALGGMQISLEPIREPCLDFLDSLWSNRGGFFGSWADDVQDCEYTYYALLALGHLSV